jgi:hypothetical protein
MNADSRLARYRRSPLCSAWVFSVVSSLGPLACAGEIFVEPGAFVSRDFARPMPLSFRIANAGDAEARLSAFSHRGERGQVLLEIDLTPGEAVEVNRPDEFAGSVRVAVDGGGSSGRIVALPLVRSHSKGAAFWSRLGDDIAAANLGNVGVGTAAPSAKLQVGSPGDGTRARANGWDVLCAAAAIAEARPLTDRDRQKLFRELLSMPVVYARSTSESGETLTRLSLVAESAPAPIRSDDLQAIGLAESTALLVAGVQAQEQEIEALRERVRTLEADVAELRRLIGLMR